jgi:DNA (cytosine-5)-methyltransferase 1
MSIPRPLLLDLFCCAGGAAKGYYEAGFDVIGVDIEPQPRYPYRFIRADALQVLEELRLNYCYELPPAQRYTSRTWLRCLDLEDVSAIHASPPCQSYSPARFMRPERANRYAKEYPRLITDVRDRIRRTGKPYAIENVEGARKDMIAPATLCGSQFGMSGVRNGVRAYIRRHRLFESNFAIPDDMPHDHLGVSMSVYGHGPDARNPLRGNGFRAQARQMMGIDWANWRELTESIPPAYTRYVGRFMRDEIARRCTLPRAREEAA